MNQTLRFFHFFQIYYEKELLEHIGFEKTDIRKTETAVYTDYPEGDYRDMMVKYNTD